MHNRLRYVDLSTSRDIAPVLGKVKAKVNVGINKIKTGLLSVNTKKKQGQNPNSQGPWYINLKVGYYTTKKANRSFVKTIFSLFLPSPVKDFIECDKSLIQCVKADDALFFWACN